MLTLGNGCHLLLLYFSISFDSLDFFAVSYEFKKQLDTCYQEASSGSDRYCIKVVGLLENSATLTISSLLVHGSGNDFCLFLSSLIPAGMI